MKRGALSWGLWGLLAACLAFFENNAGTRILFLCTLLLPLIPSLRRGLLAPERPAEAQEERAIERSAALPALLEEPGEVRSYLPGDPVNRIHWKLSAKREELLVREDAWEDSEPLAQQETLAAERKPVQLQKKKGKWGMPGLCLVLLLLLCLLPEARQGGMALLNRVFTASEAMNAYAYERLPAAPGQSVVLVATLLGSLGLVLIRWAWVSRNRGLILALSAGCIFFQVYFGLSFPTWGNIALFLLTAGGLAIRKWDKKGLRALLILTAGVTLGIMLLYPGSNPSVEAASERVRDWLTPSAGGGAEAHQLVGEEITETRHTHPLSLAAGAGEARIGEEYRLVTEEEQQIAQPRWVDYLRIALLLLLTVAAVLVPLLPLLWLETRRRRAEEARRAYQSENVSEAVQAIFQRVIAWLEAAGHGAGNRPYLRWAEPLREDAPEGYPERFARGAELFEKAAYSGREMTEEERRQAKDLLAETEAWLWAGANRRERLRLWIWKGWKG